MSADFKLKLETFGVVFAASFVSSIGAQIQHINVSTISWGIVGSIVTSAVGVALQGIYNYFIQTSLGNQLKGVTSTTLSRLKSGL